MVLVLGFIIGGVANPLYSLIIAYTNDFLEPSDMAAASGGLLFINGLGAMIGPVLIGTLMTRFGGDAFFAYVGVLFALIAAYAGYRMTKRAAPPVEATSSYAPVVPSGSPVALEVAQEVAIGRAGEAAARGDGATIRPGALPFSRRLDKSAGKRRQAMDASAQEILEFWDGIGPAGWYRADDAVDETIRTRFGGLWETARQGGSGLGPATRPPAWRWRSCSTSSRATCSAATRGPSPPTPGRATSPPGSSPTAATASGPERQFFYMPLMHSEVLTDQDRAVRLYLMRFGRGELLRHARAHREVIRRFGRFPYRNAVLGRVSTPEEVAFLEAGGYVGAGGDRRPDGRAGRDD